MEEVLKVAPNGQWSLEKSMSDADRLKMVNDFLARKKAETSAPKPAPRPASSGPNYPAGMRPVGSTTPAADAPSKEQVAAFRAQIDRKPNINVNALPPELRHLAPGAGSDVVNLNGKLAAQGERDVAKLNAKQAEDDERGRAGLDRKKAWEATVSFLANNGNKGYQAIRDRMDTQKQVASGQVPVKPRPSAGLPPQEMVRDPTNGQASMQPRQGKFHGEGATTRGKVVHTRIPYEDKLTGEKKFRLLPQVEQHHWSWDHNEKKWNHVKTVKAAETAGK